MGKTSELKNLSGVTIYNIKDDVFYLPFNEDQQECLRLIAREEPDMFACVAYQDIPAIFMYTVYEHECDKYARTYYLTLWKLLHSKRVDSAEILEGYLKYASSYFGLTTNVTNYSVDTWYLIKHIARDAGKALKLIKKNRPERDVQKALYKSLKRQYRIQRILTSIFCCLMPGEMHLLFFKFDLSWISNLFLIGKTFKDIRYNRKYYMMDINWLRDGIKKLEESMRENS